VDLRRCKEGLDPETIQQDSSVGFDLVSWMLVDELLDKLEDAVHG
jgi:hypothetical protein